MNELKPIYELEYYHVLVSAKVNIALNLMLIMSLLFSLAPLQFQTRLDPFENSMAVTHKIKNRITI